MAQPDIGTLVAQEIQTCLPRIVQGQMTIDQAIDQCADRFYRLWLLSGEPDIPFIRKDQRKHVEKVILLKLAEASNTNTKKPQMGPGTCSLCGAHLVYVSTPGDSSSIICRECINRINPELWKYMEQKDELNPTHRALYKHLNP